MSLQERFLAAQNKGHLFVSQLTLTKEFKDQVKDMLLNEAHICRKNKDGVHVPSTMWTYKLSSYWFNNGHKGEDLPSNIMEIIKTSLFEKVRETIASDMKSLGYNKVIIKPLRNQETNELYDYKIMVPLNE